MAIYVNMVKFHSLCQITYFNGNRTKVNKQKKNEPFSVLINHIECPYS